MKTFSRRGVSLVELMVAMALSGLVLGGVLGTFLFTTRSSVRISNYSTMEQQTARGLELLGRELRMAQSIVTSGTPISQITLAVPTSGSSTYSVTYAYNSTARTLSRQQTGHAASVIVNDIVPGAFALPALRLRPAARRQRLRHQAAPAHHDHRPGDQGPRRHRQQARHLLPFRPPQPLTHPSYVS